MKAFVWLFKRLITVSTILVYTTCAMNNKHKQRAEEIAKSISEGIIEYAKKTTNYHKMKEQFNQLHKDGRSTITRINGGDIVKEFKNDLEDTFKKKTDALRKIKIKVEEEKKKHVPEEITELKYLNMRQSDINDSLQIERSFSTSLPVNLNNSFVQVPTTIYAYSNDTLNIVKWTQRLDDVFRDNFNQSNGSMLFQFYGDRSGLFRVYPGIALGLPNENMKEEENKREKIKADFFDARRRGWFLQAASSPKDVVIMIDISGSMKGTKVGIARITALSLIDTLTENDFFNVITVKDGVYYIRPCTKYLIQATKYNKEKMKIALQHVGVVKNITNATLGMREAFHILNSGRRFNRTSSGCNQIIMFISDGVESSYVAKKVLDRYNANKTVRIFTFHIGHTDNNLKKQGMINTACDNRGYFYHIETLGNVWNIVLQYTQVISRPMGMTHGNGTTVFSPVYEDAASKGMVMTLSMGIFDDGGIIGVAGTDVSVETLLEKIPFHKVSAFCRVFIIDNNGFVLLHPKYQRQPGYKHRNVFLEDIEHGVDANKTIEIKEKMIDRMKDGENSFPSYALYGEDNDKLVQLNANIYFQPIDETEFSAAVVIPTTSNWDIQYSGSGVDKWMHDGIEALFSSSLGDNTSQITEIANWKYCQKADDGKSPKSVLSYYKAKELQQVLKQNNNTVPSQCDPVLVKKLLVTAGVANEYIQESWSRDQSTVSVFVTTRGGYMKMMQSDSPTPAPTQPPFQEVPYFENVAGNPNDTVTLSVPRADSDARKVVTLMSAVRVGNEGVLTAVSGATLNYDQFSTLLNNITPQTFEVSSTSMRFLIDRNGFIVFTNQGDEWIGKLIGEISSPLAKHFESVGVLKKVELEGSPTECVADEKKCITSAGNFLLTPLRMIGTGFFTLFNTLSWMLVQYSLLFATSPMYSSSEVSEKLPVISCTKVTTFYLFQEEKLATLQDDEIKCNVNCNMIFYLQPVPHTNVLFLRADMSEGCRKYCKKGTRLTDKRKQEDPGAPQRYRRQPGTCCNDPVAGETSRSICGRGSRLHPSHLLLFMLILIWCNVS